MSVFVDKEVEDRIREALTSTRGEGGFNEREVEIAKDHLESAVVTSAAWKMVFEYMMDIDVVDGEILFVKR